MNLSTLRDITMNKFNIKKICAIFLCISSFTAIADSKLTIVPLLDNVLEIPKNEHRLMAYQVTNHDNIDHSFQLKPIAGVTQLNKNPNDCQFHQVLQVLYLNWTDYLIKLAI